MTKCPNGHTVDYTACADCVGELIVKKNDLAEDNKRLRKALEYFLLHHPRAKGHRCNFCDQAVAALGLQEKETENGS